MASVHMLVIRSTDPPFAVFASVAADALVTVGVRGHLDPMRAALLDQALDIAWAEEPAHVVVDLVGVTFLDPAGLQVLLNAAAVARSRSAVLELVASRGHVSRVLAQLGLRTSARDACGAPRRNRHLQAVPDLLPDVARTGADGGGAWAGGGQRDRCREVARFAPRGPSPA